MEFIQEPKELRFALEPPVVFYRILIPCVILSTEAVFRFAALRPHFHDLPEKN